MIYYISLDFLKKWLIIIPFIYLIYYYDFLFFKNYQRLSK